MCNNKIIFECRGECHIEISNDITLVVFDDEDYFDILQPNENYECGFEGITLTKEELVDILCNLDLHQRRELDA